MQPNQNDRPFQFTLLSLFIAVSATCFVLANPSDALTCASSLAMLVLGLACVRAAVVHRRAGWISGLLFGSLFTVVGTVACCWSFGNMAVSLFAGK